jgi:hypothetical protein
MTLAEVAEECGYLSPIPIRAALVRFRLPIRARTDKKVRTELTRARLERLYVRRGLSAREVGVQLGGWNYQTVLLALRRHGIAARRGGRRKGDIDVAALRRYYEGYEWTAAEIGERFGLSASVVRDRMHRAGIALRSGGGARLPADRAPRIEELRGNRSVQASLRRDRVGSAGPLATGLLRRLYSELGLSMFDISLITGRSETAVARAMDERGIERRPPRKQPLGRRRRATS